MTETSTFFIQFLQTFLIFLTVFTFLTFFNFFSGTIFYIYGFKCHFEASRGNSGHSCCKTAAALTIPINESNDLIGQWKDKLLNKKVGYRKQIARQHSCHEKFWPGQGASSTLKIFLFTLITMQNLVTVSHTCAHVGGPEYFLLFP